MGLEKKPQLFESLFPGKKYVFKSLRRDIWKEIIACTGPLHTHIYHARMSILTLSEIKKLRYSVLKGFNHDVSVVK